MSSLVHEYCYRHITQLPNSTSPCQQKAIRLTPFQTSLASVKGKLIIHLSLPPTPSYR